MLLSTEKLTPAYYSKVSRDYQFIAKLFDLAFNNSKMNIDSMKNLYSYQNIDDRFLDLLAKTLGFDTKHEYDSNNLRKLCGAFKDILKNKGTKVAIESCINLLKNAQGISADHRVEIVKSEYIKSYLLNGQEIPSGVEYYLIKIYIPYNLRDVVLLEDVLEYILPTGFTYSIYRTNISLDDSATTTIQLSDNVSKSQNEYTFGKVSGSIDTSNKLSNIGETIVPFKND